MSIISTFSIAGSVAAVLFVLVFLIDGWTRPGYSPVRHPVSALALGRRGWVQTTNFIVCGGVISAAGVAIAFATWPLGAAIAVFGLALAASGVFRMDAMRGYPPGTPNSTPKRYSRAHQLHDHAGAVVFFGMPLLAAIATFTPQLDWATRIVSAAVVVITAVFVLRFSTAWENDAPRTGLVQRAALVVSLLWLAAVCVVVALSVG